MGFTYEYTYQDHEYIIRTMNTKHTCYIQLVAKPSPIPRLSPHTTTLTLRHHRSGESLGMRLNQYTMLASSC